MKKFLLAGLILVSIGAYGATQGQNSATVNAEATVIADVTFDLTGGVNPGTVDFGQMTPGETTVSTWDTGRNASPAVIKILGDKKYVDKNGTKAAETAKIEYHFPTSITLKQVGMTGTPDTMVANLYAVHNGGTVNTTNDIGTGAYRADGKGAYTGLSNVGQVTLAAGEALIDIHGQIPTAASTSGDYETSFTFTARYHIDNSWY